MGKAQVLIVEDEYIISSDLQLRLTKLGFDVVSIVTSGEEAIRIVAEVLPDIILMDIVLTGDINGIEAAKTIYKEHNIPIIFISAYADNDTLKEALATNPFGYIIKPIEDKELLVNIEIALFRHKNDKELNRKYKNVVKKYKQTIDTHSLVSKQLESLIQTKVIGKSKKTELIMEQAMTAAEHENTNILITGESGTGKEIVARVIHYASKRKNNNFCIVNSCAIPSTLMESEFFGHVKGAFTGAITNKNGVLQIADKGTLFLDEIADMPAELQAKLLRVIEDKKITKIGGHESIVVDFRIISATNKDIYKFVEENKFRLDLLYRLNTMVIEIPSLRERPEDIEPLLKFYIQKISVDLKKPVPQISKEVFTRLRRYSFPGNVRELKNMVENALIHSNTPLLNLKDFTFYKSNNIMNKSGNSPNPGEDMSLENNEIMLIKKALNMADFNQTRAAAILNISRDSLIRRLIKYNINIKKY